MILFHSLKDFYHSCKQDFEYFLEVTYFSSVVEDSYSHAEPKVY